MRTYNDFCLGRTVVTSGFTRDHLRTSEDEHEQILDMFMYSTFLFAMRTSQPAPHDLELAAWLGLTAEEVVACRSRLEARGWLRDLAAEERELYERDLRPIPICGECRWCRGMLSRMEESPEGKRCRACLGLAFPRREGRPR